MNIFMGSPPACLLTCAHTRERLTAPRSTWITAPASAGTIDTSTGEALAATSSDTRTASTCHIFLIFASSGRVVTCTPARAKALQPGSDGRHDLELEPLVVDGGDQPLHGGVATPVGHDRQELAHPDRRHL